MYSLANILVGILAEVALWFGDVDNSHGLVRKLQSEHSVQSRRHITPVEAYNIAGLVSV
jgi:hypothetical protein